MSLRHILLGLLESPASGYDLKREFGASLGHFWAAELAQIYPTLKSMEREGLVTSRRAASERGPPRRLYQRTANGERLLDAWLTGEAQVGNERLTWLAQVFFLGELEDPRAAADFLRRLRDIVAGRLAALRGIEQQWRTSVPDYPDLDPERGLFKQMTLELGLTRVAATLAWCDRCLARLERRGGS